MTKELGFRSTIIFFILLIPVLFSCLPEVRRDVIAPKQEIFKAPPLPAERIDKKIALREDRLGAE